MPGFGRVDVFAGPAGERSAVAVRFEFMAKRADAQRNEKALLDAAAAAFVESGVDAPVRDIAAKAVGVVG